MFGAGGGTSSYREVEETDVVLLWGSNARAAHPIWFHHLLKGIRNGARLYVIDPRRTSSAQWADVWMGLHVGSDIALANAMAREIIHAGLAHDAFIRNGTTGFDAYRAAVEPYTLEFAERNPYAEYIQGQLRRHYGMLLGRTLPQRAQASSHDLQIKAANGPPRATI